MQMSEITSNGYPPSLANGSSYSSHKYADILLSSSNHPRHMQLGSGTISGMRSNGSIYQGAGHLSAANNLSMLGGMESKLGDLSLGGPLLHSSSSPQLSHLPSLNNNHQSQQHGANLHLNGHAASQHSSHLQHHPGHVTTGQLPTPYPASSINLNATPDYLLPGSTNGVHLGRTSSPDPSNVNTVTNNTTQVPSSSVGSLSLHHQHQHQPITTGVSGVTAAGTGGTVSSTAPAAGQPAAGTSGQQGFQRLLMNHTRPEILRHVKSGDVSKDTVLNQFRDVLHALTVNPATFDEVVPYLVGALNQNRISSDVSRKLAEILSSWCIEEENFRFTGAKLSNYLCLPDQLLFPFKNHFFSYVRSEVDKMDTLIKHQSQHNNRRLEGVLLFISELYLNMGNVEIDQYGQVSVTPISFLRNVLKDAILKILELSPFDYPFMIVGRVLKLTGAALDDSDAQTGSGVDKTERIYTHVQAIQQDPGTAKMVRSMYARVLELRKAEWMAQAQPNYSIEKDPTARHLALDAPVFFLDDGTPIPAHEADFTEPGGHTHPSGPHHMDPSSAAAAAAGTHPQNGGGGGTRSILDYYLLNQLGHGQGQRRGQGQGHGVNGATNGFQTHQGYIDAVSNGSGRGGNHAGGPVHELTAEEDAAFELFLQQQQQMQ